MPATVDIQGSDHRLSEINQSHYPLYRGPSPATKSRHTPLNPPESSRILHRTRAKMASKILGSAFLALGLLSLSAAAEPKVFGLDFVKIKRDAAAAPSSNLRRRANTVQEDLFNGDVLYVVNVTIGSNKQPLSLQLDTGSSDLWVPDANSNICESNTFSSSIYDDVPAQGCSIWGSYDPNESDTFQDEGGKFLIAYGDNSQYAGTYASDTITVGSATLDDVTFAVVEASQGVVGQTAYSNQGLMGISFDTAEAGVKLGYLKKPYGGIITQLKKNNKIKTASYSLWLNDQESMTGSILFGGVDTTKYTPPLIGLPMVGTNSSDYSTVDRLAVEWTGLTLSDEKGSKPIGGDFVLPALLDSGTSVTYLPNDIAQSVLDLAGAVSDPVLVNGPVVPCYLADAQASFIFSFGGDNGPKINVSLSQLVDTNLASGYRFKNGDPACGFGIQKSTSGYTILGDTFLRSAYVVYDLDNKQIAMANTKFNVTGDPDIQEITGKTIPDVSTVQPSVALPASLTIPTGAATTEVGGPSAYPTQGSNGIITLAENPAKASITVAGHKGKGAGASLAANGDAAFAVCAVVSLLSVLGGSTFFMFA